MNRHLIIILKNPPNLKQGYNKPRFKINKKLKRFLNGNYNPYSLEMH